KRRANGSSRGATATSWSPASATSARAWKPRTRPRDASRRGRRASCGAGSAARNATSSSPADLGRRDALDARTDGLVPRRAGERIAILGRGELVGRDAGRGVAVREAEAVGQGDVAALHRGRYLDRDEDGPAARGEAHGLAGGDAEGGRVVGADPQRAAG